MAVHISSEASVFKDVNALHPDYIPPKILFRESELNELRSLQEEPSNYRGVFITGGDGHGKTSLAKFFARENAGKQQALYIDCLKCRGKVTFILHEIIRCFKSDFPSRGYSLDELKHILTGILERRKTRFLLILDDLDFLLHNSGSEGWHTLQEVLKSTVFDSTLTLTIYILNDINHVKNLGFMEQIMIENMSLNLRGYSESEIREIIGFRANLAFKGDALERGFLDGVTEYTVSSGGNLRYALELMLKAGEIAELNNSRRVGLNHLSRARVEVHPNFNSYLLRKLGRHEKLLLLSIAQSLSKSFRDEVRFSEVEKEYNRLCLNLGFRPRRHTSLWHYVKTLSLLGFIRCELSRSGYRGKTTLLSLPGIPPELVEFRVKDELGVEFHKNYLFEPSK